MIRNQEFGEISRGAPRPEEYSESFAQTVRQHAEHVLSDPLFKNSQRYSNLLRFIVDRTLKGQTQDLKERVIGNEVFGRSADYDTSADPTVRVAANEVRKRLVNYYSKPGADKTVHIEIPVGTYVADFTSAEPVMPSLAEPVLQREVPLRKNKPRWPVWLVAAVIAGAVLWIGMRALTPQSAMEKFWAPILNSSGPVLLCISSTPLDGNGAPKAPEDPSGASGNLPLWEFSQNNVNVLVGMMDVQAANELSTFLLRKRQNFLLRPSQQINLAELKAGPAVIYGGLHNQWSMLLESGLRFHFGEESNRGLRWIEDSKDLTNRSWSTDISAPYGQVDSDYVLITRAQDPRTGQWWIGVGGLTAQGTNAANLVLLDRPSMQKITASLAHGWENKNLQMVLRIRMVEGSLGAPSVIASYVW